MRNGAIKTRFPLNQGGDPYNRQIIVQADGSVLASSENGLVGWRNGKVQRMTMKNGLPCNTVVSFIEDKQKQWWLNTHCGIVQFPDSELQQWWANSEAIVHTRLYDVFDGARLSGEPSFNSAALSPDGRVWFATGFVVMMLSPSKLTKGSPPAMTFIESITVDRKEFVPTDKVRLSPHPRDLQIDYTSPSFLNPKKVKFRYRLEGYEGDWHDAGTRRQAFYTTFLPVIIHSMSWPVIATAFGAIRPLSWHSLSLPHSTRQHGFAPSARSCFSHCSVQLTDCVYISSIKK